jgi:hypothetical protein
MELRETVSWPRKLLRFLLIGSLAAGLFIFVLAIVVVAVTE